MKKEQLEQLKEILAKEAELLNQLRDECEILRAKGKEEDEEYELFRYRKEVKHLKLAIGDYMDQYKRKNDPVKEIIEREEMKQNFKIVK